MKPVHGKRALLNPPGYQSVGAICAEIEDTRDWKEGCNRDGASFTADSGRYSIEPNYTLSMSDCSRVIDFSFDFEDEEAWEANLFKVSGMISALKLLREGLYIERNLYTKRLSQIEELKKAAKSDKEG